MAGDLSFEAKNADARMVEGFFYYARQRVDLQICDTRGSLAFKDSRASMVEIEQILFQRHVLDPPNNTIHERI